MKAPGAPDWGVAAENGRTGRGGPGRLPGGRAGLPPESFPATTCSETHYCHQDSTVRGRKGGGMDGGRYISRQERQPRFLRCTVLWTDRRHRGIKTKKTRVSLALAEQNVNSASKTPLLVHDVVNSSIY